MDWTIVLQGIAIIIGAAAVLGIYAMNTKLGEMNGSIREVKAEFIAHTKLDDERHREVRDNIRELWDQKVDKRWQPK